MIKLAFAAGLCMAILIIFSPGAWAQDEYQFDLAEIEKEIEKKPYSLGGFLEFRPVFFGYDRDAALYRLRFHDKTDAPASEQYNFALRLEGSCQKGMATLYFRTQSDLRHDYRGWDSGTALHEGVVSFKPNPRYTLDMGKKAVQWGKGYAFNPVAFIARPKDPDNPTEALEGFYVVAADLIRSFDGPLQTLAFTPVILPVTESVNDDFGEPDHINWAARLYLLVWDTDIDLMFFAGESRTARYGIDFANNIATNFEIHGELALITDSDKKSIDTRGNLSIEESDILQALIGLRYLTTADITFIAEYYHNGGGIDAPDAENFYRLAGRAHDALLISGDNTLLTQAARLSQNTLVAVKPMRDYLYLRASLKEPFDILYFTPAVTSIINLNDQSFSLTPELVYSPKTDLELRLRSTFLIGSENTEYGDKLNDYKVELRVRFHF